MKVGDLVKHKWGTLAGSGLVIEWLTCAGRPASFESRAYIMWNCHGNVTMQNVATKFLVVISETRPDLVPKMRDHSRNETRIRQ